MKSSVKLIVAISDFFTAFIPEVGSDPQILSNYAIRHVILTVKFDSPDDKLKQSYTQAFASLYTGLTVQSSPPQTFPYTPVTAIMDQFFTYGFRRAFYGPQAPSLTVDFIKAGNKVFNDYINEAMSKGEFPAQACESPSRRECFIG